jgi:hypothetical protein
MSKKQTSQTGFWAGRPLTQWRSVLSSLGIKIVEKGDITSWIRKGYFLLANCSQTKGKQGDVAYPRQFYLGECQKYMKYAERHNLPFGILSDLYGIHFHDEQLSFYDLRPEMVDSLELAPKISERLNSRNITKVLYICESPSRARPYLKFLLDAKVPNIAYSTGPPTRRKSFGVE